MIISLIVNLCGVLLMVLIVWWFLIKKSTAVTVQNNRINIIVVDGVYEPAVVRARVGQTLHLFFKREDTSPCAETVIFEGLDLSATLPVGEYQEIVFKADNSGEYVFTCQMGMYRGLVIVE